MLHPVCTYYLKYTVKLKMYADINICEFETFHTIKVCDFRSYLSYLKKNCEYIS